MKVKSAFLIPYFFLSFVLSGLGQNKIVYSGKVIDSKDNTPVPFCNVYIENTSIGTVTNNDGDFRISIPGRVYNNLCFSFIGYKTKKIPMKNLYGKDNIIRLTKDKIALDEVIIMPDSTLLGFLKKAYRAIDKNYPQYPTKMEGFYRETKSTAQNEYLYFSEAILNVFKNSYKYENDPGQIEIIESRKKDFPKYREVINVRFYAGAFIPLNMDFVLKRSDFINPKHFNRYLYQLTNVTKFEGRTVYEISFDTKNDTLKGNKKGKFYLDKKTLAFIMAEFESTSRGIKEYNSKNPNVYDGVERNYFVQYYFYQNKWHLKYCKMFGTGINTASNAKLKFGTEFLTTSIMVDSVETIPYEKQLGYYDIFLDEAQPYDSTNWKDFNIIKTNKDLLYSIDQAKDVYSQEIPAPKENKLITFAKRLNLNYGVSVFQNKMPAGEYQVIFDNNLILQNLDNTEYHLALEMAMAYQLNKNYALKFSSMGSLDKNINYEFYGLAFGYTKNIKQKGRPLFLKADLYGYYDSYGLVFDKSLKNIEYGNKQISDNKLVTQIARESWGIRPQLSLSYQATRLIEIYLSCSYGFNLIYNHKLKFEEESGLFKKTYKEDIIDGTINYNSNPIDLNTIDINPFIIGFGFNFGYN